MPFPDCCLTTEYGFPRLRPLKPGLPRQISSCLCLPIGRRSGGAVAWALLTRSWFNRFSGPDRPVPLTKVRQPSERGREAASGPHRQEPGHRAQNCINRAGGRKCPISRFSAVLHARISAQNCTNSPRNAVKITRRHVPREYRPLSSAAGIDVLLAPPD